MGMISSTIMVGGVIISRKNGITVTLNDEISEKNLIINSLVGLLIIKGILTQEEIDDYINSIKVIDKLVE